MDIKEITAVVRGPDGDVECRLNLTPTGGTGSFIPTQVGMHEVGSLSPNPLTKTEKKTQLFLRAGKQNGSSLDG